MSAVASYALTDLNPNVAAMQESATLAVSKRAGDLKREGRPVIALSAGEPDFPTPRPVIEAAIRAMDGFTGYTANPGLIELRKGICAKLQRDNGLTYTPDQILCSNGAKQSVAQAVLALCRPGDEVIVPAPYWVSYPEMARLAGAVPIEIATTAEAEYRITPDQLEAAITERTRLLILCSPSNPTGSVYPREELEALAAVLRRHPQVLVVSDEIYEYVIYGEQHVSIASLEGMFERTVTVNGFSKAYAMTGWRLGYLAAPTWITKACDKVQSQFTSAPSTITQWAGVAALQMHVDQPEIVAGMVAAFKERRDAVLARLQALPGVQCPVPEGAFYLFPDVSSYYGKTTPDGTVIDSSHALSLYLLEHYNVALVPGEAFGGPSGVRMSYACSMDDLMTALDRIEAGLGTLR